MANNSTDWTVWGTSAKEALIGTEEEVKDFVKKAYAEAEIDDLGGAGEPDLYIAAPNGDEFEYDQYKDTWSKI
jgi:hypothetical protein